MYKFIVLLQKIMHDALDKKQFNGTSVRNAVTSNTYNKTIQIFLFKTYFV